MKKLFSLSLITLLALAFNLQAENLPLRGESKAGVEARFGMPDKKNTAVGTPPISSWVYPGFTVYFEGNMVLHAVSGGMLPVKRKITSTISTDSDTTEQTSQAEETSPYQKAEKKSFDITTASGFFDQYVYYSNHHDLAVIGMYADDARIIADQKTDDGDKRAFELTGAKWKQYVERAIPQAKARNDYSQFTNIQITHNGIESTIKADRYQHGKCYNDTDYYMIVKRDDNNDYYIVEEYFKTWPAASCGE